MKQAGPICFLPPLVPHCHEHPRALTLDAELPAQAHKNIADPLSRQAELAGDLLVPRAIGSHSPVDGLALSQFRFHFTSELKCAPDGDGAAIGFSPASFCSSSTTKIRTFFLL